MVSIRWKQVRIQLIHKSLSEINRFPSMNRYYQKIYYSLRFPTEHTAFYQEMGRPILEIVFHEATSSIEVNG